MSYTVLARKYRSQTFDDVVGQDPIGKTLKNAIKTGRVAHAYLFTGTRGIGKTTMARVLAKALNCLSTNEPTTEPCCKCESCVAINIGEDIDVIEIDGASNNRVDEIRDLRENALFRPARSRYKIYIIDEVHMLTVSAFNALLKILEEPPSHIKFIFATTEPNKVIATIQSRCQRFDFANISPKLIAVQLKSILKQEKIKYEEDLVLPLAKMANGSMRDALSLLDRLISTGVEPLTTELLEEFLGQPNSEKMYQLIEKIGDSDAAGTLTAAEELISSGISDVQIANWLIDYMRDLLVAKSAGAESELLVLTTEQRKRASELADKFDAAALIYNITALERLRWSIKNSDSPRALLEASLLRFAMAEHFMNVDQILSRLQDAPGIKKKQVVSPKGKIPTRIQATESIKTQHKDLQRANEEPHITNNLQPQASASKDIKYIRDHWQEILATVGSRLGPGTAGLLVAATSGRFDNEMLTIEFPISAKMQKQMCESDGRAKQIAAAFSEYFGKDVSIRFEIASRDQFAAEAEPPKRPAQRSNEIINDPAVKTVLMGLDATITGIEEDRVIDY